ncbi:MAG: hypothetical protein ABIK32_00975 [Chloroflexota bacterium]|nr:hypothetical protein [Chloroflexota bacterium]
MVAIKKDIIRKRLSEVPDVKVFWCCNGRELKNLRELATYLPEMAEEVYQRHVSSVNNDFSNWVRDVIGDVTLANELKKAGSRATAARLVKNRLEWLQTRA